MKMETNQFKDADGLLQLMNGTVLGCYNRPASKNLLPTSDEDRKDLTQLFLAHAFVFLENRDRILSDSRMFLTPVPAPLGMEGTQPTLGIFVEWWKSCVWSCIMEPNGRKWLVYQMRHDHLREVTYCRVVNPQGEISPRTLTPYGALSSSFKSLCRRYEDKQKRYDAYTLREVLDIFERDGCKAAYRKSMHIFFLQQINRQFKRRLTQVSESEQHIYELFRDHLLADRASQLHDFYTDIFPAMIADKEAQTSQPRRQITDLRLQLGEDREKDLDIFQQCHELRKQQTILVLECCKIEKEELRKILPEIPITPNEVKRFLHSQKSKR